MKISQLRYNVITRLNISVYQFSSDVNICSVYVLVFNYDGGIREVYCQSDITEFDVAIHGYKLIKL